MAESASANPPSSAPMPSDLTGVCPFISSTSSSSDVQPSEAMGAGNRVLFGVVDATDGIAFWGTMEKMSTKWL